MCDAEVSSVTGSLGGSYLLSETLEVLLGWPLAVARGESRELGGERERERAFSRLCSSEGDRERECSRDAWGVGQFSLYSFDTSDSASFRGGREALGKLS